MRFALSVLALSTASPALDKVPSLPDAAIEQPPTPWNGRLPIILQGRPYDLEARIYRPSGRGPFPLVVINHGTPGDKTTLPRRKLGYDKAARWFVARGYMVLIALRPGFGTSEGSYLEGAGRCDNEDYIVAAERIGMIEAAIVRAGQRLQGVDATRVVVVGQSAGGLGAVALGGAALPGVRGIISFAGGRGSVGQGHICSGEGALIAAEAVLGRHNLLPQLWLYAANDHFFRPELAHRMADAFASRSRPRLDFVDLPPFDDDGHRLFAQGDPAIWATYVDRFLAGI